MAVLLDSLPSEGLDKSMLFASRLSQFGFRESLDSVSLIVTSFVMLLVVTPTYHFPNSRKWLNATTLNVYSIAVMRSETIAFVSRVINLQVGSAE